MYGNLYKILNNMLEGCQVISFDYRYLYVNKALAKQSRKLKSELIGRTMMEVYPGIEETELFTRLRRSMMKRVYQSFENEFIFPNGEVGWFELRIEPVDDGVLILSFENTNRKKAEDKIIEYNARLRESKLRQKEIMHELRIEKKNVEESQAKVEAMFMSAGDGVIAVDSKGVVHPGFGAARGRSGDPWRA